MSQKITLNKTSDKIDFMVKNKYLACVTDAIHIINNDEFSLNPKPENYWLIKFSIDNNPCIRTYRIDYSTNLFSKYAVFKRIVQRKLKKDSNNFRSIIGLRLIIDVKKTYSLNVKTKKWLDNSIITNMIQAKENLS